MEWFAGLDRSQVEAVIEWFCRCLNIPARYCTGYSGDIGMPPPYGVMDFAACFEAYLGGTWYTFDARINMPRIGRVVVVRGRDARM